MLLHTITELIAIPNYHARHMIVNNDNRLSLLVVEEIVGTRVAFFIQDILEEEGADLLKRRKS